MFWAYNTTSPQIDIILCKEDLTLYELLDQENVLQELKAQNLKLIEFLLKPDILKELVTLITTEPSPELCETEQYKYPNLACELLTSDLPALNERLASEEILNKLYNFLQNDSPLNPLLSSYFSRTLSILISRKSEQNWYAYQYTCLQALEFLKAKEECIELMLKHIGTSSIMDLIHNLVTLIEGPELKQSLRSWLQSQNVIPSLIGMLTCDSNPDCQVNAASVLCSIVQKLRENVYESNEKPESDPILNLLESSETVEMLLNTIFNAETINETAVESGIDVLLTIMQPYLPGDARCRQTLNYTVHDRADNGLMFRNNSPNLEPTECNESSILSNILNASLPFIKNLYNVLQNPVKKEPIKLTSGIISPPFGKARLIIAKLVAIFVSLNNPEINKEIIRCDIPELLLDLFYVYSSNNFLHTEIEKLVAYAIDSLNSYTVTECYDNLVLTYLLKKCRLLQRLLNIWHENRKLEEEGHYRKGYMGHVIRIASLMHIEDEKNLCFHELLQKEISSASLNEWNEFVTTELKIVIEKHSTCLGGVCPKMCQSSESSFEENISNKDLKSNFKEYDTDDDQNVIFSDDPSIIAYGEAGYLDNIQVSEEQFEEQAEMFNVVCAQKWQSFNKGLDSLDDDDDDEENDRLCIWRLKNNNQDPFREWWDSDDENLDEEPKNNSSDPWPILGRNDNPWVTTSNDSSSDTDWANFEENFCDAENREENDVESCSTLATNVEQQYSLFGNSSIEKSNIILNNFSNVTISTTEENGSDNVNESQFSNCPTNMNDDWNSMSNAFSNMNNEILNQNGEHQLHSSFQTDFDCYELTNNQLNKNESEYDKNEEMVNLESICGNTLAEKIANAENDIRNKNKNLLRDFREQELTNFQMMNKAEEMPGSKLKEERNDLEACGGNCAEFVDEGTSSLQICVTATRNRENELSECLTENSFDFVTAENSASDAESSIEFGDAENSLELEMEDCTGCDRIECDHSDEVRKCHNDCNISSDELNEHSRDDEETDSTNVTENVPADNMIGEKCNNVDRDGDLEKGNIQTDVSMITLNNTFPDELCNKNSFVENESCTTLVNGDIGNHEDGTVNCDNSKDTCIGFCLTNEQVDKNVNGAIIQEPA